MATDSYSPLNAAHALEEDAWLNHEDALQLEDLRRIVEVVLADRDAYDKKHGIERVHIVHDPDFDTHNYNVTIAATVDIGDGYEAFQVTLEPGQRVLVVEKVDDGD